MGVNNLELFDYCLKKPEDYLDDFYEKDGVIITSNRSQTKNRLMRANEELIENIAAYKVAKEAKNHQMQEIIINNAIKLLDVSGMNFTEFASYWSVRDVSYSWYKNILDSEKKLFLEKIINDYIKTRHGIYSSQGYTPTTLQVRADSIAHKKSGSLGKKKVIAILEKYGIRGSQASDCDAFVKEKNAYVLSDGNGKSLFDDIIDKLAIKFAWRKSYQNKYPDFLIKMDGKILIVEHKHMKEGGGGQNKQIVEIIDFIKQDETNPYVYYISFLDGIYFNRYASGKMDKKTKYQLKQIKHSLCIRKKNYFVNTAGFNALIKDFS